MVDVKGALAQGGSIVVMQPVTCNLTDKNDQLPLIPNVV